MYSHWKSRKNKMEISLCSSLGKIKEALVGTDPLENLFRRDCNYLSKSIYLVK
jgi:hypothetical protein